MPSYMVPGSMVPEVHDMRTVYLLTRIEQFHCCRHFYLAQTMKINLSMIGTSSAVLRSNPFAIDVFRTKQWDF